MKKENDFSRHFYKWTGKEEEYLTNKYGVDSFPTIAKYLKRTTRSIIEKARAMELGKAKHATEYINATELAKAMGRNKGSITRWIDNNGLPAVQKNITRNDNMYRIDIRKFWEWAKNNKLMDWTLYERNSLGAEPKWLSEEIKDYYKNKIKNSCGKWTKEDMTYLTFYYNKGLSNKEIGQKLGRTTASINTKITKLNITKKHITIEWQPIEIEMLINMKKNNYTFPRIADELGRSAGSVAVKWCRLEKQMQG